MLRNGHTLEAPQHSGRRPRPSSGRDHGNHRGCDRSTGMGMQDTHSGAALHTRTNSGFTNCLLSAVKAIHSTSFPIRDSIHGHLGRRLLIATLDTDSRNDRETSEDGPSDMVWRSCGISVDLASPSSRAEGTRQQHTRLAGPEEVWFATAEPKQPRDNDAAPPRSTAGRAARAHRSNCPLRRSASRQ